MAKPGKFFSSNKNASKTAAPVNSNANARVPAAPQPVPMANITKPGAKAELKPNQGNISRDAVAEAAYFLWLERGGNETVNWLEAEAALARKIAATKSKK
jgi:hypothetical protein